MKGGVGDEGWSKDGRQDQRVDVGIGSHTQNGR